MTKIEHEFCKVTYEIRGMHCASCETLIEQTVKEFPGVTKTRVSLESKKLHIVVKSANHIPTVERLNQEFRELGYSFSLLGEKTVEKFEKEPMLTGAVVAASVIATLLLLEKTGIIGTAGLSPNSGVFEYFIFGLAAGISSCAALVGGLLLALSRQWSDTHTNGQKSAFPFVMFNTGRIVSFAILGAGLGLIGKALSFSLTFTSVVSVIVSALMVLIGFQMLGVSKALKVKVSTPKFITSFITDHRNFKGKYMPLLVGALTFFVPCGFTLIAQTTAMQTGNSATSSKLLIAFALGTLPMLALVSFASIKLYSASRFSKIFNYATAFLIVYFGIYTFNSQLNVFGVPNLSIQGLQSLFSKEATTAVAATKFVGDYQYLQMEANGFAYYPKNVSLKVGVPVKWEFYNNGATGCAQSVAAPGLMPGILSLKPGLNEFEFTPKKPGNYKITCAMGMVPPTFVNVYQ